MIKSLKTIVSLAVLALATCWAPAMCAQMKHAQARPPKASRKAKNPRRARVHRVIPPAKPAVAESKPEKIEPVISRRDPFAPLVSAAVAGSGGSYQHLPPGKAGLVVATVRIDGAVVAPNGMVAVVSNPEDRVYFIRVGDRLYDGDVEKISLAGVTFKENSKDAFGKPVERLVTKRIYPNAGEQQ